MSVRLGSSGWLAVGFAAWVLFGERLLDTPCRARYGGSALRAVLRKNVTDGFECVAVPVITLEVPEELYEKVRKFNVEWNWVVRRAIESYIENLEGGGVAVPTEELLKEQNRLGVQPQDLEPLSPEVEDKMYGEMRERRALDG